MRTLCFALLSTAVAAAACTSDPTAAECEAGATVTGGVISGPTDQRVDKDLTVRGIAQHHGGLTIRRVLVAGIPATNDGFNFERWSATIPIDTLAGMARTDGAPVTVEVVAIDACARQFMLDSFTVEVDPTPGVRVESLALEAPRIPGDLDYLPANGKVPALLTIIGNPDAARAVVTLAASAGTFEGAPNNQVTLQGDGAMPARATVLFAAETPTSQAALITASAKGVLAQTTVRIAGPPTLLPSATTLAPGQHVRVTVTTQGTVQACQATPAPELAVVSGGDLMAAPGGVDLTGDQLVDIDVTAASTLSAERTSIITCRDPYGQFSTGTYTAAQP